MQAERDGCHQLTKLRKAPALLAQVGDFLQATADGKELPAVPGGLPGRIEDILLALKGAVEKG